MSAEWAKNLLGVRLNEEQMKQIPNPALELVVHVTIKDVQAFGMLGTLLVGPAVAAFRPETRNIVCIRRSATQCGKWGVVLGLIAGPLMTYGRISSAKINHDGLYDRCYRLRNNHTQVLVDRASIVGAVGGAGFSVAVGSCPIFGGLLGMSAGVIGMAIYNSKIALQINK